MSLGPDPQNQEGNPMTWKTWMLHVYLPFVTGAAIAWWLLNA